MIGKPEAFGILDNDYDVFFRRRCGRLSAELRKRILPTESDELMPATPAAETVDSLIVGAEDDAEG
jgi:hypothetical protein